MNSSEYPFGAFVAGALRLWIIITALFSLYSFMLYVCMGWKGFAVVTQTGPLSIKEQTLACVAIAWLSWGIALVFLQKSRFRPERCVAVVGSVLILLLYINILRERIQYGDFGDYIKAALDLHNGRPFHHRYIYPPLLATICQPLLRFGHSGLASAFWLTNIISLVAFFWLLKAALVRYGFGRNLSLGITFLFMVVNVPILRTLGYMQINLHVTNLILLTILFFPSWPILSALSLAIATHLKASPLILALPFLWTRDRKWMLSFLIGMIGLAGVTALFYGWTPFADFLHNARNLYSANGICFRENSVDSLIRSTAFFWGGVNVPPATVLLFKIPILFAIFLTAVSNVRHSTFLDSKEIGSSVLNSIPACLVLMLLAPPLVWEHHPVFVSVPFLLITKKLNTPSAWTWYCFAYALEFLTPTFDFYPWSFGRLISPLILTCLMLRFSKQRDADWFLDLRNQVENFSWRRGCQLVSSADADKLRR
jgi:hypothetical protein